MSFIAVGIGAIVAGALAVIGERLMRRHGMPRYEKHVEPHLDRLDPLFKDKREPVESAKAENSKLE